MTPEQIEASKKLAEVMDKKGIKWTWSYGQKFIYLDSDEPDFVSCKEGSHLEAMSKHLLRLKAIPIPDIERCLKLLEDWGWTYISTDNLAQPDEPAHWELEAYRGQWQSPKDSILLTAPDLPTAAILACVEAVRRME